MTAVTTLCTAAVIGGSPVRSANRRWPEPISTAASVSTSAFCAYGTDLEALHGVAAALEALLADPELLARALRVAAEHDLLD